MDNSAPMSPAQTSRPPRIGGETLPSVGQLKRKHMVDMQNKYVNIPPHDVARMDAKRRRANVTVCQVWRPTVLVAHS